MSVELPVEAQFNAYNAHDLEAFLACFAEAFKGYRMPTESPSTVGKGRSEPSMPSIVSTTRPCGQSCCREPSSATRCLITS